MKKEIKNPFEIKLEFAANTENPSRLFYSFAEMIKSINNLDTTIAKSVNTSISSKVYLDDVEKGSIIAKLWNELIVNEDEKIDDIESNDSIREFIEESRNKSLDFISKGKSSMEDLSNLTQEIVDVAKNKGIEDSFHFAEPNALDLAKALNGVGNSTKELNKNETFYIKSPNTEVRGIKNDNPIIDIESVENLLTEEEIINESTVYYKIKRPDFLTDSQWEFKLGTKTIKAKILDEKWLEDFHNGNVIVVPGDSLKVNIKNSQKFNKHRYLISEKTEIINVVEVRRNS